MERECTRETLPLGQTLADVYRQLPAGVRRNAYVERALETLAALDIEETLRQIKALNAGLVGKPYLHAVSGNSSRVVPYEEVIASVGTFPARIGALYLHFPYCTKKCRFCHYYTDSSGTEEDWREFPRYLVEELGLLRRAYGIEGRIVADTIHFGGGTPSLIGPETWNSFTERLREHAAFDRATEIAVETDPEDVSSERVDAWCRTGVTRVSIGIQSFDDEVLRYMRRHHDRPTAIASVRELQRAGVGNINVDLMYGMPYRPFESWLADLEVVADLAPDSITCYATRPDPRNRTERAPDFPSDAARLLADQIAIERLMASGYIQYAPNQFISSYQGACLAKNNRNRCADVLGIGPRAHSIFQGWFFENAATQAPYRRTIGSGRLCEVRATKIDGREAKVRFLQFGIKLSGLRKPPDDNGVLADQYRRVLGSEVEEDFRQELGTLRRLGLLENQDGGGIRLTHSGVLLVYEVVKHLGVARFGE